jgi:serine/threonine-protein kinase HipA
VDTPDIDLYLGGHLVAHTEPMARGSKARIVYERSVDQMYPPETSLLSCSIPVGRRSEPAAAQAFLEGLLPEGQALESVAARMRDVSLDISSGSPDTPHDAIRLLGEYGRECAGAVAVVPRGGPAPGDGGPYEPLDTGQVAHRLEGLPTNPLGIDISRDIRMSLAGAQPKLLLALLGGRWHDTLSGAPSTHILKPTVGWGLSSDNECIVMTLARAAGLTTSAVWVEDFDGRRAFVTERFDRVIDGDQVHRLHQEDMCQALKIRPKDKYRIGRLSGAVVGLVRRQSADPTRDSRYLFRQMAFRAIVGDEDGHGKNYGLRLNAGDVSVAPIYDSLSTLVYDELSGTMGAPIGRQTDLAKVDLATLSEEGRAFGFDSREITELVDSVTNGIRQGVENLNPDLADERAMDVITEVIRARIDRLLRGEQMGRPSRRFMLGGVSTTSRQANLDQATFTRTQSQSHLAAGRPARTEFARPEHTDSGTELAGHRFRGTIGRGGRGSD